MELTKNEMEIIELLRSFSKKKDNDIQLRNNGDGTFRPYILSMVRADKKIKSVG